MPHPGASPRLKRSPLATAKARCQPTSAAHFATLLKAFPLANLRPPCVAALVGGKLGLAEPVDVGLVH